MSVYEVLIDRKGSSRFRLLNQRNKKGGTKNTSRPIYEYTIEGKIPTDLTSVTLLLLSFSSEGVGISDEVVCSQILPKLN